MQVLKDRTTNTRKCSSDKRRNQKFQSRHSFACNGSFRDRDFRGSRARSARAPNEREALLNANAVTATSVVAMSSNSDGKMTPGQGSSVDHPLTETSLKEKSEPAASTPFLLTPEINRDDTQAHSGSGTLITRDGLQPPTPAASSGVYGDRTERQRQDSRYAQVYCNGRAKKNSALISQAILLRSFCLWFDFAIQFSFEGDAKL